MQCFDRYQHWISILRKIKALLIVFHYVVSVRILRAARLVTRRLVLERYLHPSRIRLFSLSFEFLLAPPPSFLHYSSPSYYVNKTRYPCSTHFRRTHRVFLFLLPVCCSYVSFYPWLSREFTCVPCCELRSMYGVCDAQVVLWYYQWMTDCLACVTWPRTLTIMTYLSFLLFLPFLSLSLPLSPPLSLFLLYFPGCLSSLRKYATSMFFWLLAQASSYC